MLTLRQNLLETLKKDGAPVCLPVGFTPFQPLGGDPVFQFVRGNRVRGTTSYDRWGTLILFPEDAPAAVPMVTPENQIIQDLENWKDYVKVPDLIANCSEGWEASIENAKKADRENKLTMVVMGTGIFEQLHMLMTFEDTLTGFLMYPDEMHELIEVVKEFRLTYMKLIVEHLHPDVICSHDDWGSKTSLFMSPDTWREFFKEPYRELYNYLHANGVMVMHHGDSWMESIASDMADIGVDIWQGVLPTNNIGKLTEELDGRMALMGGIDSIIDREDVTEEEIRQETRRCCEEYGHLPHFIPSMTYGGPGTIYPWVEGVVYDEIRKYNTERFGMSL